MAELSTKIKYSVKDSASSAITKISKKTSKLRRVLNTSASAMKGLGNAVFSLKTLFAGVVIGKFANSFIEANSLFEQMKNKLTNLSGSAKQTGEDISFMMDFIDNKPVAELDAIQNAFVQLRTVGIDPTTGALDAMAEASAGMSLSSAGFKQVLKAITDIQGKGTLQSQELKLQLGQVIPTTIADTAKELNLTVAQLFKKMELGSISATEGLDAIFAGWQKRFGGSAKRFAKTWLGTLARFKTAWFRLMVSIGNSGVFKKITNAFGKFVDMIRKNETLVSGFASRLFNLGVDILKRFIEPLNRGGVSFGKTVKLITTALLKLSTGFVTIISGAIALARIGISVFRSLARMVLSAKEFGKSFGFDKSEIDSTVEKISKLNKEIDKLKKSGEKSYFNPDTGFFDVTEDEIKRKAKAIDELKAKLMEMESSNKNNPFLSLGLSGEGAKTQVLDFFNFYKKRIDNIVDFINAKDGAIKLPETILTADNAIPIKGISAKVKVVKNIFDGFARSTSKGLSDVQLKFRSMFDAGQTLGAITAKSMGDSFSTFFFDVIEGRTIKLKDIMIDFLKSIAKALSSILSQQLALGIVNGIGQRFGTSTPSVSTKQPIASNQKSRAKTNTIQIINNTDSEISRAKTVTDTQGQLISIVLDGIARNKGGSREALRGILA